VSRSETVWLARGRKPPRTLASKTRSRGFESSLLRSPRMARCVQSRNLLVCRLHPLFLGHRGHTSGGRVTLATRLGTDLPKSRRHVNGDRKARTGSPRRARERVQAVGNLGLSTAVGGRRGQVTGPASAMIRPTFSGAKNSGAGSVAACTLTNPSIASWFPRIAPSSCCISGGGGCSCANSSVNS
jgi:hypothetical protein